MTDAPPKRHRRIGRILGYVAIGLVALVVVTVGAAVAILSNGSALERLVPWLAKRADFDVSVGHIEHSLGRRLSARDVVVRVEGAPTPLLEGKSLDLDYSLAGILHGRFTVKALVLDEPKVTLVRLESGELAGFATKPEKKEPEPATETKILPLPVQLGHAEIRDGSFAFDDRAAAKQYQATGIAFQADGGADPAHADVKLDVEHATMGGEELASLASRGAIDGGRVTLHSFDLTSPHGRTSVTGSYELGSKAVDANVTLTEWKPDSLGETLGVTAELPSALEGNVTLKGTLPSKLTGDGRLSGDFRDERFEATLDARAAGADLQDVRADLRWSGVHATANGKLDLAGAGNQLDLVLDADSLEPIAKIATQPDLAGGPAHVDARLTGALKTPRVEIREATVEKLDYATTTFAKLRASGSVEAPEGPLAVTLAFDELRGGGTALGGGRVEASGTVVAPVAHLEIGPDLRADARYDKNAVHAEVHAKGPKLPLDPFLGMAGLKGATGLATNLAVDAEGNPSDVKSFRGTARIEQLRLTANGSRIESVRPISVDVAEGVAKLDAGLRVGTKSTVSAAGTFRTEARTIDGKLDLDVALADLQGFAEPYMGELDRVEGRLKANGTIAGPLARPKIDAKASADGVLAQRGNDATPPDQRLTLRMARLDAVASGYSDALDGHVDTTSASAFVSGRPIDKIEVHATLRGGDVDVKRLAAVADGIPVEARGRMGADRAIQATVDVQPVALTQVPELASSEVTGTLSARLDASGSVDQPVVKAHVAVADLKFRDQALGPFQVDGTLARDRIDAKASLPQNSAAQLDGELTGKRPFRAELHVPGLDLAPVMASMKASLPPQMADANGHVVANATISGELSDLASLEGSVVLSTLTLAAAGKTTRLAHPAEARFHGGKIDLPELALELGDGGRLRVEAHGTAADVSGQVALALDPEWANAFLSGAQLGPGKIDGNVRFRRAGGTLTVEGPANISISSISVRGIADPLSDVKATLAFRNHLMELSELRANVSDGEIHGTALADLDRQTLDRVRVDFERVPYRVPGTLRLLAGGHLEGHAARDGSEIGGDVRIDDAVYERDVELLSGLVKPLSGAPRARPSAAKGSAMLDRIQLGIKVSGRETLAIRNNVAHATMSADLSVEGTAAQPQVLGEVDVVEGKLTFFGNDFEVARGSAVFDNPMRIDPTVDFQATSTVDHAGEDVEVTLGLDGTTSKGMALTLDSEPPFPQDDLVFLLATGKTRSEALAGGGKGSGVTGLSLSALDLVGGKIAKGKLGLQEFGLEQSDTGATKVTVGKRLSDRMQVRVVDEVGGEEAANTLALNVEYQVTDALIVVAEPQSTGAFGAELRLRFEFR